MALPVDSVPPVLVLVDPVSAGPVSPVPLLVGPLLVDPVCGPPEAVSVGLVLAPPVPAELDADVAGVAGVAGVEETLPGVDEDAGALGLAVVDGLAVPVVQEDVGVALGDALPPFPLVLAFAEAVEAAVLVAGALAVPVGVAVAVVVSPELVVPLSVPTLVPLSVALSDGLLTELAGVSLGVAGVVGLAALAGLAGADDAKADAHAIAGTPLRAAEVPLPAAPAAEPAGVPFPFVL